MSSALGDSSMKASVTRRSAGLPLLLQCILSSELNAKQVRVLDLCCAVTSYWIIAALPATIRHASLDYSGQTTPRGTGR